MNSSAKQIQSSVSPNLIVGLSPSLTLKAFLRRLRWNKVKKCCTTAIYTHTGGQIRFYLVIWSVLSQFKWPLLFLHHRGRGRGTRLSIRSQDPNNSSDTERGPCLLDSPLYFLIVPTFCAMFFPRCVYLFSKSAFHISRSTAALQTSL